MTDPLVAKLFEFIWIETVKGKPILLHNPEKIAELVEQEVEARLKEKLKPVKPVAILADIKPEVDTTVEDLKAEMAKLKTHIHALYLKEAARIGMKV